MNRLPSDFSINLFNKSSDSWSITEAFGKLKYKFSWPSTYFAYSNRFSVWAFKIKVSYSIGSAIKEGKFTSEIMDSKPFSLDIIPIKAWPKKEDIFNSSCRAFELLIFLV